MGNTPSQTEDSDLVSGEEEDQEMSARCARIPLEDSNQTPKINGANQGIASRVENAVGPHKQFDGSAATIHKNRPRVRQHSDVTDFMQIYYGGFGTREEDIPNHNRYRPFQKIMQILSSMEKEQRLSDEDEGFAEPIPSQPIGDNAEESGECSVRQVIEEVIRPTNSRIYHASRFRIKKIKLREGNDMRKILIASRRMEIPEKPNLRLEKNYLVQSRTGEIRGYSLSIQRPVESKVMMRRPEMKDVCEQTNFIRPRGARRNLRSFEASDEYTSEESGY
ncbi:hypothetical protein T265_01878 [Opisthorchis viverrini]|uniref:Uncharacterized protein n=1 Tax=Opisthorchis viverrini TaxID=6198 RepID=A0A074ZWV4_OPIVI|nr:hypothetical protein T265_01878 [Opisthorchis viverrini]KER31943.1 hypothetical protein T265_01878 [Opisthorchis viverrini]